MKKIFIIVLIICIVSKAHSQFVTISDNSFRSFLQNRYPSCFNAQNMLDTTCSEIVNEDSLTIVLNNPSMKDGVKYFKNLIYLDFDYCWFSSLPALPPRLKNFICRASDSLISILSLPPTLESLTCWGCSGISNISQLPPALTFLDCNSSQLTSLPALPASLRYLNCENNKLTNLPPLPTGLKELVCDRNQVLSSLPQLPDSLKILTCQINSLQSLPDIPEGLTNLYCGYNRLSSFPVLPQSLKVLYANSNKIHDLGTLPESITHLACSVNPISSISNLPSSLIWLDCSYDSISTISNFPTGLKWIYCRYNNLTSLPELPAGLRVLFCDSNKLTSLPNLPNSLITLTLYSNDIYCLPRIPIFQNDTLLKIYIDTTKIKCVPNFSPWARFLSAGSGYVQPPLCNSLTDVHHCLDYTVSTTLCPPFGSTSLYTNLNDNDSHQWQVSSNGVTFTDISDNGNYLGTNTPTLTLNSIPSSWYGNIYTCLTNGVRGAIYFSLKFVNSWEGTNNSTWENAANWSCGTLPDRNTDVVINSDTVFLNSDTTVRTLTIATGATLNVAPGVHLTILH